MTLPRHDATAGDGSYASSGRFFDKGEHAPGVPCAYITDPDGYVIEV